MSTEYKNREDKKDYIEKQKLNYEILSDNISKNKFKI